MRPIQANGYPIFFGNEAYESLSQLIADRNYSKIFILCDTHSHDLCVPRFLSALPTEVSIEIIAFDAGESEKNIETCVQIWNVLTELGADRKSVIINVGGGVVSDLGGFVASTFKRGIEFIHVPTTLLAMVDAAIGGKNGVDLGHLKNQVGTINVPQMLLVDTTYLETLPKNEMRSGLAEMLKHGLIADKTYWQQFHDLKAADSSQLDHLIYRSIEIKNEIVLQDPTENGIRKALNFGHTLGHAIESYFLESNDKQTLLHGEAIAAGMVLESHLAMQKGLLSVEEYAQIKQLIINIFGLVEVKDPELDRIISLLIHDKKNEYGHVQFALIEGIGQIKINQTVDNDLIVNAFKDYKS